MWSVFLNVRGTKENVYCLVCVCIWEGRETLCICSYMNWYLICLILDKRNHRKLHYVNFSNYALIFVSIENMFLGACWWIYMDLFHPIFTCYLSYISAISPPHVSCLLLVSFSSFFFFSFFFRIPLLYHLSLYLL